MKLGRHLISILLVVLVLAGIGQWLWQHEEYVAVEILAPDSEDAKVAVYAQFSVTQAAIVPEAVDIIDVIVPMDVPDAGLPFYVDWERDEDKLTVTVDGSGISHEQRDAAPRVFVEKDNAAYPDGNYAIAGNDKVGDMAMKVIARQRRCERIWDEWLNEPLTGVQQVGWAVLGLMVIGGLPGAISRVVRRR